MRAGIFPAQHQPILSADWLDENLATTVPRKKKISRNNEHAIYLPYARILHYNFDYRFDRVVLPGDKYRSTETLTIRRSNTIARWKI